MKLPARSHDAPGTYPTFKDLLTIQEVAKYLRVDYTTVRRWIKNGTVEAILLPQVGLRQTYRIPRRELEMLLALPRS